MIIEKATVFSSFCENWFSDFNFSTLWQGRNYQNIQFALYSYNHTNVLANNFYVDFPLNPEYVEEQGYWYQILANSSQQGKDQLFDSHSYLYNKKVLGYASERQIWRCAQNRKQKDFNNCPAEIHLFHMGGKESFLRVGEHNHEPRYNLDELFFY